MRYRLRTLLIGQFGLRSLFALTTLAAMFRFTIRDVLWLTTLTAVLVGWWIDHTKTRIDWARVRVIEKEAKSASREAIWSKLQAEQSRQRSNEIIRAAERRGVTILDIEPETRINREFLNEVE
jgi:hypothetical protein